MRRDRVGLSWRAPFAPHILEHLDEIDVLEVMAEDLSIAPRRSLDALAELGRQCPLILHGVSLGLASSIPVNARHLARYARLAERIGPRAWSEHLAFVRAGGVELGHLAAPPRTRATIDGTLANLERARRALGSLPVLENIATAIEPPGSEMDEAQWTRAILRGSGASMLLDLHNLYANARNFGRTPAAMLEAMPLERVTMVHLSGGFWLRRKGRKPRLIDDHLHDPPAQVYDLLEALARRAPRRLSVILERDGRFPRFSRILGQLRRARAALARGRAAAARRKA